MESLHKKHICIEPLFDNEFHIGMYDEGDSLILDHKYYICGLILAMKCALNLAQKRGISPDDVYLASIDGKLLSLNSISVGSQL